MEEQIYFDNKGGISVTDTRFIVDGQTYAMSGVISVKKLVKKASVLSMIFSIILITLGVILAIGMIGSGHYSSLISPIVMVGAGIAVWITNKAKYTVILNTASGESQTLDTKDSSLVDSVIDSLNKAIIESGQH